MPNVNIETVEESTMPKVNIETPDWLCQMQSILEELSEGVVIVDDELRVVFANEALIRMGQYERGEIQGRMLDAIFPREDLPYIKRLYESGQRYGQYRSDFYIPRKDGEKVPAIFNGRVIQGPDALQYRLLTVTDISAQKRVEEQLRESNSLLEKRQREIEDELALAARVQQSLEPKSLVWGRLRVEAYYHPVCTIGGDFGLVSPLDEQHLNLVVCDVSGHGIGSALVANRIYTETVAKLRSAAPLPDVLRQLNHFVMQNIDTSVFFFTVAAARIDSDARHLAFAGAGHPPAMIVKPGREPRLLESRSMVLGALPDAVGQETALEVSIEPEERIVLYTDGLTDVFNARREMLGVEGVREIVRESSLLPFSQMKQGILSRVAAWRRGPPADDVSLVIVEVR